MTRVLYALFFISAQQAPRQAYNAAPQYQQAPAPQFHPPAAQIPAGVNAQACPNYPYCHS